MEGGFSTSGPPGKSRYDISFFLLLFVSVHVLSRSVASDSLPPHGLHPARLLCPWNFPSKNTGVGFTSPYASDLPNSGVKPASRVSPALAGGFFTPVPRGRPLFILFYFWWPWVFVAVLGLSLVAESRGYSLVVDHRL